MRVVLDHITKKFGDFTAVSEFSAVLEDGELVSLLGPSGCGKSTLLNMLSGILPVSGGKIFFDDQDVTLMPPEKRAGYSRSRRSSSEMGNRLPHGRFQAFA